MLSDSVTVAVPPVATRNSRRVRRQRRVRRIQEQLRRRPTLLIERFPITILLALLYGSMVVYPAMFITLSLNV
jgi:hypothetical protein